MALTIIAWCGAAWALEAQCTDANQRALAEKIRAADAELQTATSRIMSRAWRLVDSGRCVQKALKIGNLIFGDGKVDESLADLENHVACLKIEAYERAKDCACAKIGVPSAHGDEPLERSIKGSYERITKLESEYARRAIPNKAIRVWVDRANKIRDCVHLGVLTTLQEIEKNLSRVIAVPAEPASSPDAPPRLGSTVIAPKIKAVIPPSDDPTAPFNAPYSLGTPSPSTVDEDRDAKDWLKTMTVPVPETRPPRLQSPRRDGAMEKRGGAMEKEVRMVRVTVLYPNEPGKRFDHAYYAGKHLPMVMERLKGSGMLRYEVDKGLAGGGPGAPAPFVAACHLYFNAVADFQKGISAHGAEIMGDIPNYTDISPQIQISEIVVG